MKPVIPWTDNFNLAEASAMTLAHVREKKYSSSSTRQILGGPAVKALQFLWRSGDVSNRVTIASRILVWLGKDPARVTQAQHRILQRETWRGTKEEVAA